MTTNLSYDPVLGRVLISLSGWADGTVRIERSLNASASDAIWAQGLVRGGRNLPVVGGAATLSDYDGWAADVTNHYRVRASSWEDMVQIFTSSGTWTKPSGLVAVKVTVVGGGGAGGGSDSPAAGQSSAGNGGACGGIAVSWIPATDLGATETVTVGAGGTGSDGANGTNGGASTFTRTTGTNVVAAGGSGGTFFAATATEQWGTGTAGATGTSGDLLLSGGSGAPAVVLGPVVAQRGGNGGDGPFGGGGNGSPGTDGGSGRGFGAGGGGSAGSGGAPARAGGDGAPGIVVIEHFFDEIGV